MDKEIRIHFTNEIEYKLEVGETVTGEITGVQILTSAKFDNEQCVISLMSDDPRNVVISMSMYNMVKGKIHIGDTICITYKGKKSPEDEKSLKIYNIELIKWGNMEKTLAESVTGIDEDLNNGEEIREDTNPV